MTWFQNVWTWISSLFGGHHVRSELGPKFEVRNLTEDPDELEPMVLYLIGEHGHLWHASLSCPCGCGAAIQLNLLTDDVPNWKVQIAKEGVTVDPSIWRTSGCRSHFFLRKGRVQWCSPQIGKGFAAHRENAHW